MQKQNEEWLGKLCEAMLSLRTVEECRAFFADLMTVGEMEQFAQRLWAASLICQGQTYASIIAETKISSATLSRVSACVKNGTGYRTVLQRLRGDETDKN